LVLRFFWGGGDNQKQRHEFPCVCRSPPLRLKIALGHPFHLATGVKTFLEFSDRNGEGGDPPLQLAASAFVHGNSNPVARLLSGEIRERHI
jgi:hypothetical protein